VRPARAPGTETLRVGCVKYLNARPLIHGWIGKVDFDHPAALCQRLANGELDVALVSSFEFLRNPIYLIIDDISISSDGPVYSVVLAYRGDISQIEEIELDPASQTSTNLLHCLLAEFALTPRLISDTGRMPVFHRSGHARLLIGDQAIRFRQEHADEFLFWDLGEQWKKFSGLPFVYAIWLIRPEVAQAKAVAQDLRVLRDKNLTNLDDLISKTVAGDADPGSRNMTEFLAHYYHQNLRFTFQDKAKQGLQAFARLCAKHGLLPSGDIVLRVV
jgi:chorismate dehydratase